MNDFLSLVLGKPIIVGHQGKRSQHPDPQIPQKLKTGTKE